jgi:lysophospholipase L1-like esterase
VLILGLAVVVGCAVTVAETLVSSATPAAAAAPGDQGKATANGSSVPSAVPVAVPPAATPPRHARPVRYVALGDSYSSAVGAGDYSGGSCDRSTHAFPALWAANHSDASFVFAACAAATIGSVNSTQLSALDGSATLVTITVGGNDAGFESVLSKCVMEGASACDSAVTAGEVRVRGVLRQQLTDLYDAIASRAPDARVIALGYPNFYDLSSTRTCLGLSSSSRTKINEGIGVLDEAIAAAARTSGIDFLDPRPAFEGHEICDSSSWLHSVDITEPGASYHPTDAGQSAYLSVLSEANVSY